MLLLGKHTAGGALGYYWDEPDQAVEVTDDVATELIRLNPRDYYEVQPTEITEIALTEPEVIDPLSIPLDWSAESGRAPIVDAIQTAAPHVSKPPTSRRSPRKTT